MYSVFFEEAAKALYKNDYREFKENYKDVSEHVEKIELLAAAAGSGNNAALDHIIEGIEISESEKLLCLRQSSLMAQFPMFNRLLDFGWLPDENNAYTVAQEGTLEEVSKFLDRFPDLNITPRYIIVFSCMNQNRDVLPYIFNKFYNADICETEEDKGHLIDQLATSGSYELIAKIDGCEDALASVARADKAYADFYTSFINCYSKMFEAEDRSLFTKGMNYLDANQYISKDDEEFNRFALIQVGSLVFNEYGKEYFSDKEDLLEAGKNFLPSLDHLHMSLFEIVDVDRLNLSVRVVDLLGGREEHIVNIGRDEFHRLPSSQVFAYLCKFQGEWFLSSSYFPLEDEKKESTLLTYKKELSKIEEHNLAKAKKKAAKSKKGKNGKVKPAAITNAEKFRIMFHIGMRQDWQ